MNRTVTINLAVEDSLSEAVLRKILACSGCFCEVGRCFQKQGAGYLKKNINGFNNAAKNTPFLLLTDLDQKECAPGLIQEWLKIPRNPNLLFRVAVREVEAWLLADRPGFSQFLNIAETHFPLNPDDEDDPKRLLIDLARKSRKRHIREALVPAPKSTAKVGPDYNGTLIDFTQKHWNVESAARISSSLERTLRAVKTFHISFITSDKRLPQI